jgi:cysteinyl-tRNA synthetase
VSIEPASLYQPAIAQVSELLDEGHVTAAVDALLELDELDRDVETRATVHALIMRLGAIAANPRLEVADVVGPYIDMLLQARQAARANGRWDEADAIRNQLTELRVTIKDAGGESTWEIQQ